MGYVPDSQAYHIISGSDNRWHKLTKLQMCSIDTTFSVAILQLFRKYLNCQFMEIHVCNALSVCANFEGINSFVITIVSFFSNKVVVDGTTATQVKTRQLVAASAKGKLCNFPLFFFFFVLFCL